MLWIRQAHKQSPMLSHIKLYRLLSTGWSWFANEHSAFVSDTTNLIVPHGIRKYSIKPREAESRWIIIGIVPSKHDQPNLILEWITRALTSMNESTNIYICLEAKKKLRLVYTTVRANETTTCTVYTRAHAHTHTENRVKFATREGEKIKQLFVHIH